MRQSETTSSLQRNPLKRQSIFGNASGAQAELSPSARAPRKSIFGNANGTQAGLSSSSVAPRSRPEPQPQPQPMSGLVLQPEPDGNFGVNDAGYSRQTETSVMQSNPLKLKRRSIFGNNGGTQAEQQSPSVGAPRNMSMRSSFSNTNSLTKSQTLPKDPAEDRL